MKNYYKLLSVSTVFILTFFVQFNFTNAQVVVGCPAGSYYCVGGTNINTNGGYQNQYQYNNNNYQPNQSRLPGGNNQRYPELCAVFNRTIGLGDEGQDVKRLQVVLGQEGLGYLGTTGYFGRSTERAVKNFQRQIGYAQTGGVGPKTLRRMQQLWCGRDNVYQGNNNGNGGNIYPVNNNGPVSVSIAPTVSSGNNITIGWSSQNAVSCTINGQQVQTNGSQIYNVYSSTTYTITCSDNYNNVVTKSIIVQPNVNISNFPTVNVSVNPSTILVGQTATLYWSSQNTQYCTYNGQQVNTSGSQVIYPNNVSSTYLVTCYGNGLTVSGSVTAVTGNTNNGSPNQINIISNVNNVVTINVPNCGAGSINWGDGTNSTQFMNEGTGCNFTHTYTNTGTFTVTVSNIGGSVRGTTSVTVNGTSNNGISIVSQSGNTITISFPTMSGTINWGDGTVATLNNIQCFAAPCNLTLTHTYSDSGSYSINVYNTSGASTYSLQVNTNTSSTPTLSITPTNVNVTSGQSTTLITTANYTTSCTISGGPYTIVTGSPTGVNFNGSISVNPTTSTTYTITCAGTNGQTVSASAYVTVNGTNTNTPNLTLVPDNQTILYGAQVNIMLTKQNINSCTIQGGIYTTAQDIGSATSIIVTPTQTTTYVFSCTGSNGSNVTKSSIITVNSTATVSATSSPTNVVSGTASTITLTKQNITSCSVLGGVYTTSNNLGSVNTLTVSPATTTTYTFTCLGPNSQTVTTTAVVTVVSAPAITVTPYTQTISHGQAVTYTLNKTNISSCSINNQNIGSVNFWTVAPDTTTTYNFNCIGTTGTNVATSSLIIVQ